MVLIAFSLSLSNRENVRKSHRRNDCIDFFEFEGKKNSLIMKEKWPLKLQTGEESSQEKCEELLGHIDCQILVLCVEPDEQASLYVGEFPDAQSNVHRDEVCLRHDCVFD